MIIELWIVAIVIYYIICVWYSIWWLRSEFPILPLYAADLLVCFCLLWVFAPILFSIRFDCVIFKPLKENNAR